MLLRLRIVQGHIQIEGRRFGIEAAEPGFVGRISCAEWRSPMPREGHNLAAQMCSDQSLDLVRWIGTMPQKSRTVAHEIAAHHSRSSSRNVLHIPRVVIGVDAQQGGFSVAGLKVAQQGASFNRRCRIAGGVLQGGDWSSRLGRTQLQRSDIEAAPALMHRDRVGAAQEVCSPEILQPEAVRLCPDG